MPLQNFAKIWDTPIQLTGICFAQRRCYTPPKGPHMLNAIMEANIGLLLSSEQKSPIERVHRPS